MSKFKDFILDRIEAVSTGSSDYIPIIQGGFTKKISIEKLAESLGLLPVSFYKDDGSLIYIAHRGGTLMYPEAAIESFRMGYTAGVRAIEMDVQSLSDGTQAIMHDDTVDRTTTGTGNVSSFTPAMWRQLTIDGNSWHGSNYGSLTPPLFADVLNEFRGRTLFVIEVKGTGNGPAIVAALQAAGIKPTDAIVESFTLSDLTAARAAGYPIMIAHDGTGDLEAAKAAGVQWAAISKTATTQQITDWVASGINVLLYNVNRRSERDPFIALGVKGFFTDDSEYLSSAKPLAVMDKFALQTWMPGMIHPADGVGAGSRGKFIAPDWWGWDDTGGSFLLQGWACPIKNNANADNYSIEFSMQLGAVGDTTRWGSVYITNNDVAFANSTPLGTTMGYHILLRKNGTLDIYKRTNLSVGDLLTSQAGILIPDDMAVRFRLTVSPTTIKITRLKADGTEDYSATSNDTTYRGGYFHLGHNSVACKFREIVVK